MRDANDRAEIEGRPWSQRKSACHSSTHTVSIDAVVGKRMLESEVRVSDDDRCAAHQSRSHCHSRVEVEHRDFAQWNFGAKRAKRDLLTNVSRAVAEYSAPHNLDATRCVL